MNPPLEIFLQSIQGFLDSLKQYIEVVIAVLKKALEYAIGAFYIGSYTDAKVIMVLDRKVYEFIANRQIYIAKIVKQIYRYTS